MNNPFAKDGLLTRFGENIPLVNNGIQELHRRNGNEEALQRARHTNPIGAHGAITKVAEYVPGVNNVVQAAHSVAGQPEALSRARAADPVGANGAVTQVAERVPGVSSVVQALHERSGQEAALQRAAERDPLAGNGDDEKDGLFELRHSAAVSLAFERRVLVNGAQCWLDRADALCADVPDELVGATVFACPIGIGCPERPALAEHVPTLPKACLTLRIGCPARVYLLAEAGPRSGGIPDLGWKALPEVAHLHLQTRSGGFPSLGEGETVLGVWARDCEDSGSLEIPVREPWVGCVAVRVLPDQDRAPPGPQAADAARAGASTPLGPALVAVKGELAEAAPDSHRIEKRLMQRLHSSRGTLPLPPEFRCPLTQEVMCDPVVAADGNAYERDAIYRWLQTGQAPRSPLTNEVMASKHLETNVALRSQIVAAAEAASRAVERGEKIEDLEDRSRRLADSSANFLEQAQALNRQRGGRR